MPSKTNDMSLPWVLQQQPGQEARFEKPHGNDFIAFGKRFGQVKTVEIHQVQVVYDGGACDTDGVRSITTYLDTLGVKQYLIVPYSEADVSIKQAIIHAAPRLATSSVASSAASNAIIRALNVFAGRHVYVVIGATAGDAPNIQWEPYLLPELKKAVGLDRKSRFYKAFPRVKPQQPVLLMQVDAEQMQPKKQRGVCNAVKKSDAVLQALFPGQSPDSGLLLGSAHNKAFYQFTGEVFRPFTTKVPPPAWGEQTPDGAVVTQEAKQALYLGVVVAPTATLQANKHTIVHSAHCMFGGSIIGHLADSDKDVGLINHKIDIPNGKHVESISVHDYPHPYELQQIAVAAPQVIALAKQMSCSSLEVRYHVPGPDYALMGFKWLLLGKMSELAFEDYLAQVSHRCNTHNDLMQQLAAQQDVALACQSPFASVLSRLDGAKPCGSGSQKAQHKQMEHWSVQNLSDVVATAPLQLGVSDQAQIKAKEQALVRALLVRLLSDEALKDYPELSKAWRQCVQTKLGHVPGDGYAALADQMTPLLPGLIDLLRLGNQVFLVACALVAPTVSILPHDEALIAKTCAAEFCNVLSNPVTGLTYMPQFVGSPKTDGTLFREVIGTDAANGQGGACDPLPINTSTYTLAQEMAKVIWPTKDSHVMVGYMLTLFAYAPARPRVQSPPSALSPAVTQHDEQLAHGAQLQEFEDQFFQGVLSWFQEALQQSKAARGGVREAAGFTPKVVHEWGLFRPQKQPCFVAAPVTGDIRATNSCPPVMMSCDTQFK